MADPKNVPAGQQPGSAQRNQPNQPQSQEQPAQQGPQKQERQERQAQQERQEQQGPRNQSSQPQGQGQQRTQPAGPVSQQQVQADAQQLGLDPGLASMLLQTFGGLVTQALLGILRQKGNLQQQAQQAQRTGQPAQPAGTTAAQAQAGQQPAQFGLDLTMARTLTVVLLQQHRQEIVSWLNDQEQNVLDTIISKLQGQQNPAPNPAAG